MFFQLGVVTATLVLFIYASFSNAQTVNCELVFIVLLMDHSRRANVLNYGSNWCQRVTGSLMASEIQALVLGSDFAFSIYHIQKDVTGRIAPIEEYVDSRTVFDVSDVEHRARINLKAASRRSPVLRDAVMKDGRTTERHFRIERARLGESYET